MHLQRAPKLSREWGPPQESDIKKVFKQFSIDAVMLFAASALVQESMINPFKYYNNNVSSCINLLKVMLDHKIKRLIFLSSCAVYEESKNIPIQESSETNPINPYGRSKLMIEIIKDISNIYKNFFYISLWYFNVAGAHSSGEIGEYHNPETHLIPNILKAARGEKKELIIFGDDYPTSDGTCIRDYIHVEDLCYAHLLALKLSEGGIKNEVFNLGNNYGFSIKEVIKTVEKVTGEKVKVKLGCRRPGDPARLVASSEKAQKILGWQPKANLEQIIKSAWEWEKRIQLHGCYK
jgi:UDP-glucose 4-epimerase